MADSNEMPDSPHGTDSDSENSMPGLQLDLGDEQSHQREPKRLGTAGPSEAPRREDNPFSFKHFLRSDSGGYQGKGARPKVYCEGRQVTSVSDLELPQNAELKQTRLVPEYPSALPDFVQDHLVVEQCYLGGGGGSVNLDINLPDFTPSRNSVNINRVKVDSSHNVNRRCDSNDDLAIPLDLPLRHPLDLPQSPQNGTRGSAAEVGVSKSLPDFLADGAVRQQKADGSPMLESPDRENERLRRDLDVVRRQLAEQNLRVEELSRELEIAKRREHEYTQNLAKALEQVEDSLKRSNAEVHRLKMENRALRGEEGAAGGHDFYAPNEIHAQRLAQELKAAASTAEHSLRQLLTGVDNLRIMAATLENMHRIEEKRESFLDLDEDTGPAL